MYRKLLSVLRCSFAGTDSGIEIQGARVAKKKSLAETLWQAHVRRKKEQERQQRLAEQEQRKLRKEQEQKQRQRQREEEKQRLSAQRQVEQQERTRKRVAAEKEKERLSRQRKAEADARARKREEAERAREDKRKKIEQLETEAQAKTKEVSALRDRLDSVLADRARNLSGRTASIISEAFNREGPDGLSKALSKVLTASEFAFDFPRPKALVEYRPESRELIVDYELPPQKVVPKVAEYKHVKSKGEIQPVPLKTAEVQETYGRVLSRTAIRGIAETFDASPVPLVTDVVLNGYVSAVDPATGQIIRPCLISVHVERDVFDSLVIDSEEFDPQACLRRLNAIVSQHPHDLEPVRPVVEFDLSRYKTVEGMDVAAGLDSRMDLLSLKPNEFEYLIRQLFEKIGMVAENVQMSRDGGVDVFAYNTDPILSGLCIIQAKRYKDRVDPESVYALSGTMHDKSATKGVLVTTSWFGKDSREFAQRSGRIELIDGRNLRSLLKDHMNLDVLIGLPKLPRGWEGADIGTA